MDWSTLLLIALMGGAVYFLMIRPQQKRAKEQTNLMNSLAAGSRVMTISGIIGTIKYVGDKQAILEISPGVEMTIDKRAISPQAVEDEFEYTDGDADVDAEPDLTDDTFVEPAPTAGFPEAQTVVTEPGEARPTDESDDTAGTTWDTPEQNKN